MKIVVAELVNSLPPIFIEPADLLMCVTTYMLHRTIIFTIVLHGCETWSLANID